MVEASPIWGLAAIAAMVFFSIMSVPIAASVGIVGVVMFILFYGDMYASIYYVGIAAWGSAANYSFSMFPLFVFMGALIARSGLGKDAFEGIFKLMGRVLYSVA